MNNVNTVFLRLTLGNVVYFKRSGTLLKVRQICGDYISQNTVLKFCALLFLQPVWLNGGCVADIG